MDEFKFNPLGVNRWLTWLEHGWALGNRAASSTPTWASELRPPQLE